MSTVTESVDVDVDVTTAYNQWTPVRDVPGVHVRCRGRHAARPEA